MALYMYGLCLTFIVKMKYNLQLKLNLVLSKLKLCMSGFSFFICIRGRLDPEISNLEAQVVRN